MVVNSHYFLTLFNVQQRLSCRAFDSNVDRSTASIQCCRTLNNLLSNTIERSTASVQCFRSFENLLFNAIKCLTAPVKHCRKFDSGCRTFVEHSTEVVDYFFFSSMLLIQN